MENFHTGMKTAFEEPFAVVISNTPRYKELLVETLGGHSEALNAIRSVVRDYSNEVTGKLRDDVLQMQYCDAILDGSLSSTRNTVYLTIVFMILSVCLSALGMFAMSLYFCSMLSKSIAVRKVYGAEVSTVTGGILKQFVVMTGIAAVLSLPLSIGFIRRFLQGFGNHITFPYWAIIASVALILAVTLFSTYFCANRAARRNPVDSLKME